MHFFRNHIIRSLILTVLMAGFVPALLPADTQGASPEYMSSWLSGFAGDNNPEQAREKISQIADFSEKPGQVLKQASKIISDNIELFALPGKTPESTDEEVFNLLLHEWNRHQESGSMDAAMLLERHTKAVSLENTKFQTMLLPDAMVSDGSAFFAYNTAPADQYRLLPLISGIAINAP